LKKVFGRAFSTDKAVKLNEVSKFPNKQKQESIPNANKSLSITAWEGNEKFQNNKQHCELLFFCRETRKTFRSQFQTEPEGIEMTGENKKN
jgi:hypothetical protein